MLTIQTTAGFDKWLSDLRDVAGRSKVLARITRLRHGNPGDVKPVGQGVSEMRIAFGPGYRVYFVRRRDTVIVLLAGGDKASQVRDIAAAKARAAELE